MLRIVFDTQCLQGLEDAVEHIRVADGHSRFLLRHFQLTGVVFPAVQNLDFLIAVKFVAGNDFLRILELRRGIQHRLFQIYHDR